MCICMCLIDIVDKEINSVTFDQFDYIYYTEADQLLYIRSHRHIMDALDQQQKSLIITPHRMYTVLLPTVYPQLDKYVITHRKVNLANVTIITESELEAQGSCCDNGRFVFPSCHNFWYLCPKHVSGYKFNLMSSSFAINFY